MVNHADQVVAKLVLGQTKRQVRINYLSHALHIAKGEGTLDQLVRASILDPEGPCQDSLGQ